MSRVPLHKRDEVVELSKEGCVQPRALTGSRLNTVNRIVQTYRDGRIQHESHKRRARVTSMDEDLQILAVTSEKSFQSAKDVRRTLNLADVSDSTVRRRLREAALRSRIAAQKRLLTWANKTARLKFALDHRTWRVEDWKYAPKLPQGVGLYKAAARAFYTDVDAAVPFSQNRAELKLARACTQTKRLPSPPATPRDGAFTSLSRTEI
ncbi:hypothetical protein HPB49_024330 [Dermacentor silvarum]|uniref:Uncharacterized protein n=1 Tax=Dermacentor silvarum TaxID=543639 RepID=A0ACB8E4A8_DERSI|nr:hypothetical protein HPB49_024330 [Dermacentor silvarum]